MCLAIHSNLLANNAYFLPTDSVKEPQIEVLASSATSGFPFFERYNVVMHYFGFSWSRIGWQRQPWKLLYECKAFKKEFGKKFLNYYLFDARGDIRHTLVARLLNSRRFIQYNSGVAWPSALRGLSARHVFLDRQNSLRQFAGGLGIAPNLNLQWPWLESFRLSASGPSSRTILLAPEASNRLRYWKSDNWVVLSKRLQQLGYSVTLITYRGDAVPDACLANFDNIWKGPMMDLARLIGAARVVIGVDSFIGHLAAAIGTPTLSLFGPQNPECWRPWGKDAAILMAEGYPCRPCGQKFCVRPQNNCMDVIHVDQVIDAFKKFVT